MKHKALTVLECLLEGFTVEFDGHKYGMDEKNRLMIMHDEENGMAVDWPLDAFINYCEKLDDKEIFIINANSAFNKYKRSIANKRNIEKGVESNE